MTRPTVLPVALGLLLGVAALGTARAWIRAGEMVWLGVVGR